MSAVPQTKRTYTIEEYFELDREAEGNDVRSSEELPVLFRTPFWVEAFAKLLLASLIGNWVLKVLGH